MESLAVQPGLCSRGSAAWQRSAASRRSATTDTASQGRDPPPGPASPAAPGKAHGSCCPAPAPRGRSRPRRPELAGPGFCPQAAGGEPAGSPAPGSSRAPGGGSGSGPIPGVVERGRRARPRRRAATHPAGQRADPQRCPHGGAATETPPATSCFRPHPAAFGDSRLAPPPLIGCPRDAGPRRGGRPPMRRQDGAGRELEGGQGRRRARERELLFMNASSAFPTPGGPEEQGR